MTSGCLDRKEVRGAIWGVHSTTDRPAGGNTGRLFLAFGGPVCADRISNCPLDRVLTYKNLIYLLNLQICFYGEKKNRNIITNSCLMFLGEKNFNKITLSCTISEINAFYAEIQDGCQKWQEIDFWEKSPVDSVDTLGVKNFAKIALSCSVFPR